jgi:hypothetical protein
MNPKVKFSPVMQLGEAEFTTHISGKELLRLWLDNVIEYFPEIQRGTKVKLDKDKNEVEVPVFSMANVKKITESMLKGNYFTDLITLNIVKDGTEKVEFKGDSLIVYSGKIAISDGQHRIRALESIKMSNDTMETAFDLDSLIFPVKITIYDVPTAQQQFYQFSQGLKISSSRSEYFNSKDLSNILIKHLMEKGRALHDKVEVVKNTISKKDTRHLVSFATLVNAVDMVYALDTEEELDRLTEYLDEFFKELINLIPELSDYDKRLESKEHSLIAENFMFYGYVAISQILFNVPNWKEKMPLILQLDLSKDSKLWYGKVIKRGKKRGYSIINSNDSRRAMINRINKEFTELLYQENKED